MLKYKLLGSQTDGRQLPSTVVHYALPATGFVDPRDGRNIITLEHTLSGYGGFILFIFIIITFIIIFFF